MENHQSNKIETNKQTALKPYKKWFFFNSKLITYKILLILIFELRTELPIILITINNRHKLWTSSLLAHRPSYMKNLNVTPNDYKVQKKMDNKRSVFF